LLGDVARDLGEAQQSAVLGPDRVDYHACPEQAAILAHAPALGLIAAFLGGDLQHALRLSLGPVGVGIEAREMLADDLAGLVAFEALRAGIPAGHDAIRIE